MKYCPKCKTNKNIPEFGKDKNTKSGFTSHCRDCRQKSYLSYSRSRIGLITRIYRDQRQKSINRNVAPPDYTKKELITFAFNNPSFEEMYKNWVESCYDKMLCPSFDRINNKKGYSINNIQLITWKENLDNGSRDVRLGLIGRKEPVIQFDLDGLILNEYHSMAEASRKTGASKKGISDVCRGKYKTSGGYKWMYKSKYNQ